MATRIHSNGSKWLGQEPDPIEMLFDRLDEHVLDPTFETCGNFVATDHPNICRGFTHFFGNFVEVSAVFCLETDDAELVERLTAAIRANQSTEAYAKAKEERARQQAVKAKRLAEQRAAQRRRRRW